MDEIGVVKSTEGDIAKVIVERKSVCDQCEQNTCLITDNGAEMEAINYINAKEGQKVKIAMKPYTYLKGTILIYGVPVIALIIGAIFGKGFLTQIFTDLDPDVLSAISGFSALIVSFIIVKIFSSRIEKKGKLQPVIDEILEN